MSQPLFSIIITVLNGAQTIGACLNSIAQQSFPDYEVVIVDGGSTDHTVAFIQASGIKNKHLAVIPGIGLYAGLNAGIDMAQGQWFYFIGCDDKLYSSDTLNSVAELIVSKADGVKVIVGNVHYEKSGFLYKVKLGSPYWMRYQVHHQGMFYDQSIFANVRYNESMRIASDYEVNLKLVLNGVKHQHTDLIVCNFDNEGISHRDLQRGAAEMQEVHNRVLNGLGRHWLINYFTIRYHVGLLRDRYHLVDLKARIRRFVKSMVVKSV